MINILRHISPPEGERGDGEREGVSLNQREEKIRAKSSRSPEPKLWSYGEEDESEFCNSNDDAIGCEPFRLSAG